MGEVVHIVFGSEAHRSNYARRMAVNPLKVILATQPEKIQRLMTESVDTIKVLRFPKDIWKPPTFPCEKRVAETEGMIKGYQRLGVTVVEIKE